MKIIRIFCLGIHLNSIFNLPARRDLVVLRINSALIDVGPALPRAGVAAGVAAGPANLSGWTMPGAESGLRARAGPPARLSNFLFRGREDDAVNLNSALIDAGPALSRAGVAAGVAAGPANLFQDGRCLARSPD